MNVIKLRGLPWSCTIEDVVKFLHGIKISVKPSETDAKVPSVYLTTNAEGRPSGEAFIELADDDDLEAALKRNNAMMGQRYIEVFRSNQEQLSKHIQESWSITSNWSDPVVRLRGLPYECTSDDIADFFAGLNIAFDGILMVIDFSGRFNGEAFVQFNNILDANKALERHKQKISNRYIEVFRSSRSEMVHYSSNSHGQTRDKQPNKMIKRNSNWNNGNDMFKHNGSDFNRIRQKPYSRNVSQNTHNRYRGQNQSSSIPSLMANFTENKSNYNKTASFSNNLCRTGFGVRLRGLPYSVNEAQIRDFFKPLIPVNVILTKSRDGRSSGECEVDFENQNLASEALKYDKKYIGNRYIEIFALNSGAKIQNSMSINTFMKQDFSQKNINSKSTSLKSNLNTNGYASFESGINSMPAPPPPHLMNQQNNIGSLLGPVPSLSQTANSNMNEIIFADMAKQMTQMYSQFQSQHQFMTGMNMVRANGPSSSNRRF